MSSTLAAASIANSQASLPCWALMRGEHNVAALGVHPRALEAYDTLAALRQNPDDNFSNRQREDAGLLQGSPAVLEAIADAIGPHTGGGSTAEDHFVSGLANQLLRCSDQRSRPVGFRTTDFKSHDMQYLIGGDLFEVKESSPQIGMRGIMRMLTPHGGRLLDWELRGCRAAIEAKVQLGVLFPFVRTPDELAEALDTLSDVGVRAPAVGMMVEVPSNILQADEFASVLVEHTREAAAIPVFILGLTDLVQTMLGFDRDMADPLREPLHEHVTASITDAILTSLPLGVKWGVRREALDGIVESNPYFASWLASTAHFFLQDVYVEPV